MGGFETTAHTLSFTLFSIATNPSVEAKLVEELAGLGLLGLPGKPARQLQHEDLRKLVYTGNVIKEAMRKYPVVAGLPRSAPLKECSACCAAVQSCWPVRTV